MTNVADTNIYLAQGLKRHRRKVALVALAVSLILVSGAISALAWVLRLVGVAGLPYSGAVVPSVGVLVLCYCIWGSYTLKRLVQGFESASGSVLSHVGYDAAARHDRYLKGALAVLAVVSALLVFLLPALVSIRAHGPLLSIAVAAFCSYQFLRAKPVQQPMEASILEDTRWLKPLGKQAQMQYGMAMNQIIGQDRPITFFEYVLLRSYLLARFSRERHKRGSSK